jgi:hypothetical protein
VAHRAGTHLRILLSGNSFPIWSCSVWGLPCLAHYCASGALLPHLFTLTAAAEHLRLCRLAPALPSCPVRAERLSPSTHPALRRCIFCGTFRKVSLNSPSRTLSGTLLCGVRTFLSLDRAARETPASTSQTATIRFDISYPYYKMNSGSKGFRFPGQRLCLIAKAKTYHGGAETRRRR